MRGEYAVEGIKDLISDILEDSNWNVTMPTHDAAMHLLELQALLIRAEAKCGKILEEVKG